MTSNVFLSNPSSSRRRAGTRAPFAARRATTTLPPRPRLPHPQPEAAPRGTGEKAARASRA